MSKDLKTRRRHKRRKIYTKEYDDDEDISDASVNAELRKLGFCVDEPDDDGDHWGYEVESKVECERFTKDTDCLIDKLEGKDFNARYFHEHGFKKPIYIDKIDDLGLSVPSSSDFSVADVKKLVGANRMIDVVDVKTQRGFQMTMREFVDYYQQPKRDRLLNVLSLEFSKTKLAEIVKPPSAIKYLDWVELAWPRELRDQQTDATNALNSMKYPKVQNYCLMSVGGCYTDFHVDFGGTSVWYHILRGQKIFWLVPPTEENCQRFQTWTLSGRQHKTFFGDLVEHCVRVKLKAGDTFMIPSGWFHAVYTPVDSLVFGGNFLHSFAIPMQLSVYEIERNTHVPLKFRYPFFLEMQWFVLERYYWLLTDQRFLRGYTGSNGESSSDKPSTADSATLLTDSELEGLQALVNWLQSLSGSKRRVPDLIERPDLLLDNFQKLLPALESLQRQPSAAEYTILSLGNQRFSRKTADIGLETQGNAIKKAESDEKPIALPQRPMGEGSSGSSSMLDSKPVVSPTELGIPQSSKVEITMTESPVQHDSLQSADLEQTRFGACYLTIVPADMVPVIGAECTVGTEMEPG